MKNINVVIPFSPSHTPGTLLDRAIESIENQTIPTQPVVVEDSEQRGPAWARNVGLSRADSRYVAFCDADDYWHKRKLEKQLGQLSRQNCSICITQTESEKTGKYNIEPFESTREFAVDVFLARSISFTSSILVDTSKIETRFDEELSRREDHLFALQAAAVRGACFVNEPLTMIHKHSEGLSNEDWQVEDRLETARRFYNLAIESFPHLEKHESVYWHSQYHRFGRKCYHEGDYNRSVKYLKKALSYRLYHRTVGAFVISCLYSLIHR